MSKQSRRSRAQRWAVGAALLGAGAAGGGVLASTLSANAATTSTGGASSSSSTGPTATSPPGSGLDQSGTITAVGTSSVTIGSTTYAVDANSDIDKNGEATLSSLAVGDAVTFSTVTTNGTATIDKLHTGTESLNRPQGRPDNGSTAAPSSSA
jgi:hypothetical protein